MAEPTVSIGMPVYNGDNFLADALDSILNQTFTDFEVIISDNGSTDGTQAICERYAAKDTRISYVRHEANVGAARNFNHTFSLAKGRYFKWAAHDDLMAPSFLGHLVDILDENPTVVLAYTRALLINDDGEVVGLLDDKLDKRQSRASDRIRNFAPGACNPVFGLIRSEALTKTSLIGPYPSSDMILLWQLLLLGEFHEYSEVLFLRRSHAKSSVRANPDFASRMRWFDPNRKAVFYMPNANRVARYMAAVSASQLPADEKLRCTSVLVKRYGLHPKWIYKDLSLALQESLGFNPMSRKRNLI